MWPPSATTTFPADAVVKLIVRLVWQLVELGRSKKLRLVNAGELVPQILRLPAIWVPVKVPVEPPQLAKLAAGTAIESAGTVVTPGDDGQLAAGRRPLQGLLLLALYVPGDVEVVSVASKEPR